MRTATNNWQRRRRDIIPTLFPCHPLPHLTLLRVDYRKHYESQRRRLGCFL